MTPPRLARWLIARLVAEDDRPFVLRDLDERFARMLTGDGARRARRWYRRQAAFALPSLLGEQMRSLGGYVVAVGSSETRVSVRSLARAPAFSLGVSGTLAIGLVSAATVGTVAWYLWLAPLPFPDSDRIVRLYELSQASRERTWISPPLLDDLRGAELESLLEVAGVSQVAFDWRSDPTDPAVERLRGAAVSPELFSILGLRPAAGRFFGDATDEVVLSRRFWRARFGADPGVVGRPLTLGDDTYRVAGVVDLPDPYPVDVDLLAPLTFTESELVEGMRGARYLEVIALVAPGSTVGEASAAVDAFIADLGRRHPLHAGGGGVALRLHEDITSPFRGLLAVLLGAGGAFLLLAVVNVAGLVTARRVAAMPELSVRRALGASRQRLLGSALLEGTILGGVAGMVAALGTRLAQPAIVGLLPADLPRLGSIELTPAVAALVVAGGLVAGGWVGLLGYVLTPREGARPGRVAPARALRTRRTLVVGQVAVTTVLAAAGAGVLANAISLSTTALGFEPEPVAVSVVTPGEDRYPSEDALRGFWTGVLAGIEARGLEAAAGTNVPMMGSNMRFGFRTDGSEEQTWAQYHSVTERYFGTLGIEVIEGRPFQPEDRAPVVIVNRALARAHFSDGSAVGRTIDVVGVERTIVGVVESTRHFGPDREAPLELYVPLWQDPWAFGQVVVRAEPDEAGAIVAAVAEVAPGLVASPPAALRDHVRRWFMPIVAQLVVVGVLALVGLSLATLGLYAVVAYQVGSRRKEIGIRLALGAPSGSLVGGVLRQGAQTALLGVGLGALAWWGLRPLMVGWTDVARIADPAIMTLVALLVTATCLVATLAPALRSARVDPTVSLEADG